jgi:hypothetical protein
MKGIKMNKIIAALIAGLFAVSVSAFAADAPKVDAKPAAQAADPVAKKHTVKHSHKATHVAKADAKADSKAGEAAPAK